MLRKKREETNVTTETVVRAFYGGVFEEKVIEVSTHFFKHQKL